MMNQFTYTKLSWPARLGLTFFIILTIGAGIVLSAIFFALFLVLALPVGLWLWWQSRKLKHWARQQQEEFIETDYEIETEYEVLEDRRQNNERTESDNR